MILKILKKNIIILILLVIFIGCLIYYYHINNTIIEGQCLPCGNELNFKILDLLGIQCKGINCYE